MTNQERLDYLLATVSTPTNTAVTLSHIKSILSVEAYAMVRLTLEAATVPGESIESKVMAAEMADAMAAMRTVGLSFSSPDRQAVIDLLAAAGSWPNVVRDAVKSLGLVVGPRWQSLGHANAPTLASLQAVITKSTAMQAYRDVHSAHIVPVLDGSSTTKAALAEAFRDAATVLETI